MQSSQNTWPHVVTATWAPLRSNEAALSMHIGHLIRLFVGLATGEAPEVSSEGGSDLCIHNYTEKNESTSTVINAMYIPNFQDTV